ncbi:putative sugar phosphate/phosphate translocator [Canna indica]|uniref:Sugar phosphate/phosphate translocator n=1 Tax=Canna indica TaxID=4628 RepID=A0AAQ3KSX7_9LILI|nr:putative sugar phosphate/phosphate translocator [Canna indica]
MTRSSSMLNFLYIFFSIAIVTYGEVRFDVWGVTLHPPRPHLDPAHLQGHLPQPHHLTLLRCPLLHGPPPCPWALVELPVLRDKASFCPDIIVFRTNSCAFALNLVVFVKDWLLNDFSWCVIRDTVTTINLLGYGVAFLDVAYYNHAKL